MIPDPTYVPDLTELERQVLVLMVQNRGRNARDIADTLHISPNYVYTSMRLLRLKFFVANNTALIARAIAEGVISADGTLTAHFRNLPDQPLAQRARLESSMLAAEGHTRRNPTVDVRLTEGDPPSRQAMGGATTNAVKSATLPPAEVTHENPGAGAGFAVVNSFVKRTLPPGAAENAAVVKSFVNSPTLPPAEATPENPGAGAGSAVVNSFVKRTLPPGAAENAAVVKSFVKSQTLQPAEATPENPGAGAGSAVVNSFVKRTLPPGAAENAAVVKSFVKSQTLQPVEATPENPGTGADSAVVNSFVKRTLPPGAAENAAVVKSFVKSQTLQPTPKEQAIVDWLVAHPDKAHLSSRTIATLIGDVSHTLVAQAKLSYCSIPIVDWLTANPDQAHLSSRKIARLIGHVSHTLVAQAKLSYIRIAAHTNQT